MKLKYIASPFTHPDKGIQILRKAIVTYIGARLINEGHHIFGPITESSEYAQYGVSGTEWDFWGPHDRMMLRKCEELFVVTMKGWEESVGVQAEIAYAKKHKMPITYIDPKKYIDIKELI